MEFEYIEQDPYNKSAEWLAVNPRGLVPVIIHEGKSVYESSVCIEFLDDLFPEKAPHLLPQDPHLKAKARLLSDHISKKIVPPFYALLQKQTEEDRSKAREAIIDGVAQLMRDAGSTGPFLLGAEPTLPDIMLAPHAHRFDIVLGHFRDFAIPSGEKGEEFKRFHQWMDAVNNWDAFKKTLAEKQKLVGMYVRYADNSAKTLVADAIRDGTAFP